jgi:thiol-disulfide isomerase/thioredoxin
MGAPRMISLSLLLLPFPPPVPWSIQEPATGRPIPAAHGGDAVDSKAPEGLDAAPTFEALLEAFHAAMPRDPATLRDARVRAEVAPRALPVLAGLVRVSAERPGFEAVTFGVYALALGAQEHEAAVVARALAGQAGARAELACAAAITAVGPAARCVALDAVSVHVVQPDGAQRAALRALAIAGALTASEARTLARAAGDGPLAAELVALAERWERDPARTVGQPFTFEGTKLDGGAWSSTGAHGKVLVVDLWATWCAPCVAALPGLVALRADFGARGLEVVGVSCDGDVTALRSFLAARAELAWPQLVAPALLEVPPTGRDARSTGASAWHPLATRLGVTSIPCVLVIDRKGVLRRVGPPEGLRAAVEALLAE